MWHEFETEKEAIEALQSEVTTLTGLLQIAERENEKLKQEIIKLETIVQRQKEQLRSLVVYYTDPNQGCRIPLVKQPGLLDYTGDYTGQAE